MSSIGDFATLPSVVEPEACAQGSYDLFAARRAGVSLWFRVTTSDLSASGYMLQWSFRRTGRWHDLDDAIDVSAHSVCRALVEASMRTKSASRRDVYRAWRLAVIQRVEAEIEVAVRAACP